MKYKLFHIVILRCTKENKEESGLYPFEQERFNQVVKWIKPRLNNAYEHLEGVWKDLNISFLTPIGLEINP